MRVLFDAFWWAAGPIANRTVQREIILAWARMFPDDELVLALRKDADPEELPATASIVRTSLWPHALANRLQLPRLARSVRADATVVHNYTPRRGTTAVFIHDAMFVDHPEWFSRAERIYFAPMLPWARGAAVVATSTQTEADRIRRHGHRLAEPIATGLGVPPALTEAQPRRPPALGEVDGFAMTVGRLNVRKNLEKVLEAAAFATRLDPRHPLVVIGGTEHSGVAPEFSDEIRRSVEQRRIVLLGGIEDPELAWLYANTSLAITLSRDEGFGLPAIEAAAFDAPLVASDIPVFRETVGDYAHFVSPDASAAIIAAGIDAAWGSASDGGDVIARYSWENAAARLRAALLDALSGPRL
jgi:glycosyltransferase involved in cell wall biosynthesis